MRVSFYSPSFYPKIGGLETVVMNWAIYLSQKGHTVEVITTTQFSKSDNFFFKVHRNISHWNAWKVMRGSDVVIQFNLSLKGILPCLLSLRPLVISHHGTNRNLDGSWVKYGWIKHWIADNFARMNIACSDYVAQYFKKAIVNYSPYSEATFGKLEGIERDKDITFLGRLTSDKGCDIAVKAIGFIKRESSIAPNLYIIGDGPELQSIRELVKRESVENYVHFVGQMYGLELANFLNSTKVLVVPSRSETFGIAAVEGLACGCRVVASKVGGLPEAVGAFGYLYESENVQQLATVLKSTLRLRDVSGLEYELIKNYIRKFSSEYSSQKLEAELLRVI